MMPNPAVERDGAKARPLGEGENMTTRQIRDLAIRVLGLYYLAHAIICLPQILGIFSISGKEAEYIGNKAIFVIASLIPIAMYFVVAYVLLVKTRAIMALLWPTNAQETGNASPALSLTTRVSLIGLFYLIGSVGGATSEPWILGAKRELRMYPICGTISSGDMEVCQ